MQTGLRTYFAAAPFILSVTVVGAFRGAAAQSKSPFNGFELGDKTGNIRKPDDYRDLYQMLGAYMVLDPKGNQMHVTYASPGTAEYYRRNKKFADGTVLVKEGFGTDHAQLTTGNANWAGDTKVWFVLIKDTKVVSRTTPCGAMVGVGRFSSPMRPASRSRLITKGIAWAATLPRNRTIGST